MVAAIGRRQIRAMGITKKKLREHLPSLSDVQVALAEKKLRNYIEQAWPILEPKQKFIGNWHIDCLCDHLEAVTQGHILRLLINMPPRHMKSLTVSVFWPTWEWGPGNTPQTRWLFSSYAQHLSTRDSVKCRRLITSPWYQQNWGDRYYLVGDQNEKTRYENNRTGYRVATSVGGMGTGEGGDRIIVDDPHNVLEGESDAQRNSVLAWWDESMSTRGNDPIRSARVIVMQRVHERDLSGHVLAEERGYVHVCLPARYSGKNRIKTNVPLANPWKDPRSKEGEPLWKKRYGEKALAELTKDMTEYSIAGQLQQEPTPRGGGMFKRENLRVVKAFRPDAVEKMVRYWDKAGTQDGGKRTAGVLMAKLKPGFVDYGFIVLDVKKGQWSAGKRELIIKDVAEFDGKAVEVWVEQEPGSGGKESAESTIKNLAGFVVHADRVTGSKESRAEPFAAQIEIRNVVFLDGDWTKGYMDELEKFSPGSAFKDQVDASSGAFAKLNVASKRAGSWGRR